MQNDLSSKQNEFYAVRWKHKIFNNFQFFKSELATWFTLNSFWTVTSHHFYK